MKKFLVYTFVFSFLTFPLFAQQNQASSESFVEPEKLYSGTPELPVYEGWVNDFESALDADQKLELETLISNYEAESSNEIALVLVDNFGPYQDVAEYTAELGNKWGVGKTGANNGVVFLVSISKRVVRISTGKGLEEVLTDQVCQEIINNYIIPQFKSQNYFGGIKIGVEQLIAQLNGN